MSIPIALRAFPITSSYLPQERRKASWELHPRFEVCQILPLDVQAFEVANRPALINADAMKCATLRVRSKRQFPTVVAKIAQVHRSGAASCPRGMAVKSFSQHLEAVRSVVGIVKIRHSKE